MRWHPTSPRIGVFFGYVLVAVVFSWPLPLQLSSAFTGDPGGDTGVYVWNQWVFRHEVVGERRNPLTTEQVLSLTQRVNLAQHNYTAFLDLLALPLIPRLGVVTTFNVVYLAVTVLTALATYALVRRVLPAARPEAWLAGVLFAWSPILVARSGGHFSLVAAAPLPAFLLFLIQAERTRAIRYAALAGLSMAWAAFCDVYYAVYCLMIAIGYVALRVVRVSRRDVPAGRPWRWTVDVLILVVAGLVIGLLFGRGRRIELFGLPVSIRGLYTPMLVLTVLVVTRVLMALRPHITVSWVRPPAAALRAAAIGVIACAGPLSPVLYGLAGRNVEDRISTPKVFWRSSPHGVDLLQLFELNPAHRFVRAFVDAPANDPTAYVDYTAAFSLVALSVIGIAFWRAAYRPHRGWIWLAAGFAVLSLGPFLHIGGANTHVPMPWAFLRYVPLVGAARSPARFAVVAALGVAVLFCGALIALRQRYPERARAIFALVSVLLLFELFPAPRVLYSAEIPSIYRIIAADPRPVRVLELPFGVRDGVSSAGNFSPRYLYYQTLHGKRLMGGYLSRISKRRIDEVRAQPTLDALLTLSEGVALTPERDAIIRGRAANFLQRTNLAYVVIDHGRAPPVLENFVVDAWQLEEIAREGSRTLYKPTLGLR